MITLIYVIGFLCVLDFIADVFKYVVDVDKDCYGYIDEDK